MCCILEITGLFRSFQDTRTGGEPNFLIVTDCTTVFLMSVSLFTFAGSRKNRNYILDQTNVYASARLRKMKNFVGFKRKCAVLVTNDPELQRRSYQRTHMDGNLFDYVLFFYFKGLLSMYVSVFPIE